MAAIRLYNPTAYRGSIVVETPVGRLAAPGIIDWGRTRLVCAGRDVPYAIREGAAHWRASLNAAGRRPRAEDLLVFSIPVAPGRWTEVRAVPGRTNAASALRRRKGLITISYPALAATLDEATGSMLQLRAGRDKLLAAPLTVRAWTAHPRAVRPGEFGPSPDPPDYRIARESALPPFAAAPAGIVSNAAMTQVSFVLTVAGGPALALTYRVHAAGAIEIELDERPWKGPSPWTDRIVEVRWSPSGDGALLPGLANRPPFYGFRDYTAAVEHVGRVWRTGAAGMVELGEATVNGRSWRRRLQVLPAMSGGRVDDLVVAMREGVVVEPAPATAELPERPVRIRAPRDLRMAAERVAAAIGGAGGRASVAHRVARPDIELAVARDPGQHGLSGDGFAIRRRSDGSIAVTAATRFGCTQAAARIAAHLAARKDAIPGGRSRTVPLIAENPIVDLRSGGFGGGDFEVDFPYGDEAEWERVLGQLADAGMNVMADLGMWSAWKMPVSYRYMPEIRSDMPDAYDEVSGARFAEYESHKARGLRLLRFLHDRGVRVWLWLPIGAVPTTYAAKHPEAMSPTNRKAPCFTHPLYEQYLRAYLRELLETYAIDGIVMIRDDNGGICDCDRCRAHVSTSRSKSAVWEQYLILIEHLRRQGFRGDRAVYPYFDHYEPRLEALLPADLKIVGHGAGLGVQARDYATVAPMGDTWLDNLFASFRLPGIPRMRQLLANRPGFWIGGAYTGTELPWEAVGRFGWEPTLSVNSFRYEWGVRKFGPAGALPFALFADAADRLWELNADPMLPLRWMRTAKTDRLATALDGRAWLARYRQRLASLRGAVRRPNEPWFRLTSLFATFVDAHLNRLERLSEMREIAAEHRGAVDAGVGLPAASRDRVLALHAATYRDAERLEKEAAAAPGHMMARTVAGRMLQPYREWGMQPYGFYLERALPDKQFAGEIRATLGALASGQPFTLRLELHNRGTVPWVREAGHRIELGPSAAALGLPVRWDHAGEPIAPGDRRVVELLGLVPPTPGEQDLTVSFFPPFDTTEPTMRTTVRVVWR